MKKSHLKSILGLALMSLLLTVITPTNTFAQYQPHKKDKKKKVKVVTPVKHYKKQPRRGAQVTVLPKKTVVVTHRNLNYNYDNGIFYRPACSNLLSHHSTRLL